jgi:tyrosyl-tRNA synthetase
MPRKAPRNDKKNLSVDAQLDYLRRGTAEIIHEKGLRAKLEQSALTGVPLRVKLGADPTAPDLHLGHAVVIRKLRAFQELGHTVIFLIGDFTGMIGDPSGTSTTRPKLTREQIEANAETYKMQIFKLLDPQKTIIDFNSRWMDRIDAEGFIQIASHATVKQILERDDFQKRIQDNRPLHLHEILYPLVMAYDSVALDADVELGGTDQKFNILMGRNLQRQYQRKPQVAMIMPILEGIDGVQKMSKSLGNYIGISEQPLDMFGKVMSIPDQIMWRYYELCTDLPIESIKAMRNGVAAGQLNPRDLKVNLAKLIVADFHSSVAADDMAKEFMRVFKQREAPIEIQETEIAAGSWKLPRLLVDTKLAASIKEARRLIDQGAVRIDGKQRKEADYLIKLTQDQELTIQVGKRHFLRVRGKAADSTIGWLEQLNELLRTETVHPEKRLLWIWNESSNHIRKSLPYDDQALARLFHWLTSQVQKDPQSLNAVYVGAYFFDSAFWPVLIPLETGGARVDPLDSLNIMPEHTKLHLLSDSRELQNFVAFWAACLDYALGVGKLLRDKNSSTFFQHLIRSGHRQLELNMVQLFEQARDCHLLISARVATEMFLKAFIARKTILSENSARKMGHNLSEALDKCLEIDRDSDLSTIRSELRFLSLIHEPNLACTSKDLWRAYRVAQFTGATVVRSLTSESSHLSVTFSD